MAAGLCPDPVGELKRSPEGPDPIAPIRGLLLMRGEGKGGNGREEEVKRRKGSGKGRGRKGAVAPPHMTCLQDAPGPYLLVAPR